MSRPRSGSAVRSVVSAAGRLSAGRARDGGAVVLAYHDVVPERREAAGWTVGADQLRAQVTLLRRLGFRIVPLSRLSRALCVRTRVDGLAAIVFDDALAGVPRHAAPVLLELDAPATVAVVSGAPEGPPAWWPGSGPVMTTGDLRRWVADGFEVAAHGRTHASLVGLPAARLREETHGARAELEDRLGLPVRDFAYPHGHHDASVRDQVAEAGYDAAYTFLNGRIAGVEDRFRLPRLTMGRHVDRWRLAYHLGRAPTTWPDHQLGTVAGS